MRHLEEWRLLLKWGLYYTFMVKSSMAFYDLIFPLNLSPLIYEGPQGIKEGSLVSAELRNTLSRAIVAGQAKPPRGLQNIRNIKEVYGVLFSPSLINLLRWMSEYYIAKEGIVLREMVSKELLKKIDSSFFDSKRHNSIKPIQMEGELRAVSDALLEGRYKSFLLHAPSTDYQIGFLNDALYSAKGAIVLCPEIADARYVAESLKEGLRERVCVFHSRLSPKKKLSELRRILSGECDIVIGSRTALFSPIKKPSLIVVLDEESLCHKKTDGLSYSVRDMAVMRGYMEGSVVVLSSVCPSFESYYNALTGKYTLIKPEASQKRPNIKIIDMRSSKKLSPNISKTLFDKTIYTLKMGGKVALVINRRGYSLLGCEECGWSSWCDECAVPLVLYKKENALRCGYCKKDSPIPDICPRCKSPKLIMPGVGIEKVEEEIKNLVGDSVQIVEGKRPKIELIKDILVGTKSIAKRREFKKRFSLISVISGDSFLGTLDFRAEEKTFQEIIHLSERCLPEGEIVIQCRQCKTPIYKMLRRYDYEGFFNENIKIRKELFYPPFSRLAIVFGKGHLPKIDISSEDGVEILGPASVGGGKWKILIKSKTREALRRTAQSILKEIKGASLIIDPLEL